MAETIWKHGYCNTIQESFGNTLVTTVLAYIPKKTLTPQQAIELIRDAGGVAVLAHPGLTQRDHVMKTWENTVCRELKYTTRHTYPANRYKIP